MGIYSTPTITLVHFDNPHGPRSYTVNGLTTGGARVRRIYRADDSVHVEVDNGVTIHIPWHRVYLMQEEMR